MSGSRILPFYSFSRDPAGLPTTPFHQVTGGATLHFVAMPWWNAATGLGLLDLAHVADDFYCSDRNRPADG
jgi:hypothetical protein